MKPKAENIGGGSGAVTVARIEELPTYQIVLSMCKIGFPLQRNLQISRIIMVKII